MSNYLYYPQTAASVSVVAQTIAPPSVDAEAFLQRLMAVNPQITSESSVCSPKHPLVLPNKSPFRIESTSLSNLSTAQHGALAQLSHSVGGSVTLGIAHLLWETGLLEIGSDLKVYGGNGVGFSTQGGSSVLCTLDEYDRAAEHLARLKMNGTEGLLLATAARRLRQLFEACNNKLNLRSQVYLNKYAGAIRRSPLSKSAVAHAIIPIPESNSVSRLAKFARAAELIRSGTILIRAPGNGASDAIVKSALCELPGQLSGGGRIAKGVTAAALLALTPSGINVCIIPAGMLAVQINQVKTLLE